MEINNYLFVSDHLLKGYMNKMNKKGISVWIQILGTHSFEFLHPPDTEPTIQIIHATFFFIFLTPSPCDILLSKISCLWY